MACNNTYTPRDRKWTEKTTVSLGHSSPEVVPDELWNAHKELRSERQEFDKYTGYIGDEKVTLDREGKATYIGEDKVYRDREGTATWVGDQRVYRRLDNSASYIGDEKVYQDQAGNDRYIGEKKIYPHPAWKGSKR